MLPSPRIIFALFALVGGLQSAAQEQPSSSPTSKPIGMDAASLVGTWQGSLFQNPIPGGPPTFDFQITFNQAGSALSGTSRISTSGNYAVMTFTGNLIKGGVHFKETGIAEKHYPAGWYFCLKQGDLTLAADGSLAGRWTDPSCNAGSVSLKKVAATDCSNPNTSSAAKVLLDNYIDGYKAKLKRNAQSLANGAQSVLDGLQDFISQQSQQQHQWCGDGSILENSNASGAGGNSGIAAREKTPTTNPEDFEPVRGRDAKRNKTTGEIWVKDRFHKDEYEVYKNLKQFENSNRTRIVWDDGRVQP